MGVEFQLLQSQGESAVPERALTPHALYTLHNNNNNNNNNKPIKRLQVKMASKIRQNFHEDSEALINKQINMEWGTPLQAMEAALELEKTVNQSLLDLHSKAGDKGDAPLCDFLEGNYLNEQVDGIKEIGDMITKIKRAGDGLGLHIIDKEMQA